MANTGTSPCSLNGLPTVLLTAKGVALPIEQRRPSETSPSSVVLPAHSAVRVDLTVFWSNWCKPDPGPIQISITLADGGGSFSVPFDGPPDSTYLPRCDAADKPSILQVLGLQQM